MGIYRINNTYADEYCEYVDYVDVLVEIPSIVDFGTAMANKRRNKINRKK